MIPLPLQPKIIEKKGNRAIFQIERLYPGYGVTVGNSLRRVLLSSLEGAAITQTKITGIQHEFSTIPGILEDVITIMLNLKQLRFKIFSDEPQKAYLEMKGEKVVTAADFKLPSQLEIINKTAHIATLTDKTAKLEMEIQVEKGLGYVPREMRKTERLEIGQIPLDSFFTPIRKVSYQIENMRIGERTDFDRLTIEIETDGTITPEEAFRQASETLFNHFSLLSETFKAPEPSKKEVETEVKIKKGEPEKIKIEDLKISSRVINALLKNKINTVEEVIKKGEAEILELEGMGEKGLKEIKKALKKLGLELKTEKIA